MQSKDFLEERRRRQRDLVATKKVQQNLIDAPTEEPKEVLPLTFGERLKHFWFYYKYFVIVGVIVAFVLTILVRQCAKRESFDAEVVLFAYDTFTTDQISALEEQLELCFEDFDGDKAVNIRVLDCSFDRNAFREYQAPMLTKLTANISSNAKALLYITDAESFEFLSTKFDVNFFVDKGLTLNDGMSTPLPKSFYDAVYEKTDGLLPLPEELRVSIRTAQDNTIISKEENIEKQVKNAEDALMKIAASAK